MPKNSTADAIAVLLILGAPAAASAAPAVSGPICRLEGRVLSVEERVVVRDADWAASWAIAPATSYTDVKVAVLRFNDTNDCMAFPDVFQLAPGETAPTQGACIAARSAFSGDEFRIGTWLSDIREIDCDQPPG
jgi:hypothetical protein